MQALSSLVFKSILILFLFVSSVAVAQSKKNINVKHIDEDNLNIDGILDEVWWQTARTSSDYMEYFPSDGKLVQYQTEIKMLYTDDFLYIGITAFADGTHYKTPSYQRDFSISGADVVNLMFDTFSDRSNAFLFGMNQFGVHREGLISNGGITGNLDLSWDTKWEGEAQIYETYSIMELRIPMSAFKYREGTQQWKFNSMRANTIANTKSSWAAVPQNQDQLNLGYYGIMTFEKPLGKSKSPISIIPYITPSYNKDNNKNYEGMDLDVGMDVKVPIANSMMLDLTINPDFSSADVVAGENNVTRFELKQDETRQFFIDNGDMFNNSGLEEDALAFYSRRIGVATDTSNNTLFIPIIGGAKFTGKVNQKFRIGMLNVQTESEEDQLVPANNNLMLSAEHKVFSKSNLSAFMINRQVTSTNKPYVGTAYNRVFGSDFRHFSDNNEFDAHVFVHKSLTPGIESNAISTGTDITLEKREYTLSFIGQYVDEGFQSDLGYTRRKDIIRAEPFAEWKLYPTSNLINTLKFNTTFSSYWMPSIDMFNSDKDWLVGSEINFTNGAELGLTGAVRYVYLNHEFDPTGGDPNNVPIPIGKYYTQDLELNFQTDKRKAFWFEGNTSFGSFYNGTKFTSDVTFQYRYQPIFFVSMKVQYDDISLPTPYASAQLWYLGPTVNFTFTKKLFWNTDIQYSTQTDNMLLVSRLQWRYAPLSDIFLTYTDTYNTSPSALIERGIYLRISYWFDI